MTEVRSERPLRTTNTRPGSLIFSMVAAKECSHRHLRFSLINEMRTDSRWRRVGTGRSCALNPEAHAQAL
jgi:hypothetical protein